MTINEVYTNVVNYVKTNSKYFIIGFGIVGSILFSSAILRVLTYNLIVTGLGIVGATLLYIAYLLKKQG